MNSHSLPLFEKISCLVMSFSVFCYQNIYTLYQDLSFDTPFPVTLYKEILDESMDIYSDVQMLLENKNNHYEDMDSVIGRIVRLFSRIDALTAHQKTTNSYRKEDGDYLIIILGQIQTTYRQLEQTKQYPLVAALFDRIHDTLMQVFDI